MPVINVTDLGLLRRLASRAGGSHALSHNIDFRGVLYRLWSCDRPKGTQADLPCLHLPAILPEPAR